MWMKVIRMFLWLSFLTGFAYPMGILLIGQSMMSEKANGSMLIDDGKVVGSKLIAQKFEESKYFWPRPSAIDYNPLQSGGSNLGPISSTLQKLIEERRKHIQDTQKVSDWHTIPSELLYASASGLDPQIGMQSALFQLERIAKARNMDEKTKAKVGDMIIEMAMPSYTGFFGIRCVNVLLLNLALDRMSKHDR